MFMSKGQGLAVNFYWINVVTTKKHLSPLTSIQMYLCIRIKHINCKLLLPMLFYHYLCTVILYIIFLALTLFHFKLILFNSNFIYLNTKNTFS